MPEPQPRTAMERLHKLLSRCDGQMISEQALALMERESQVTHFAKAAIWDEVGNELSKIIRLFDLEEKARATPPVPLAEPAEQHLGDGP